MAVFALMMAAALIASEPDGVVATAPATSVDLNVTLQPLAPSTVGAAQGAVAHGLSTDQQIDRWIAARSVSDTPWVDSAGGPADDRKMHGEVSFGIGTGGYRDYGAAVSLPIGESARLDISYRQVENGYGGYGYGRRHDPLHLDDSGYAFPGHRPGAAAEFESRLMRPGGPPRRFPTVQPDRPTGD
ncbi:MAG: hypothetical protein Q8R45_09775 [Brevundimonas sp.]|uniref:hypothetical protein n=1 Tax=Brevundimonas sp. TaxID=1871086 RepID=UPI0027260675|nr:hypothetical protein [Brevundimonas sp.]MDO9588265.1 hypothetical protein [Brevundimonas sp.]MDP3370959.1 hypothetical protein [Brevundimonas sp.]MDP3657238.1 hypothetical protein [Brevundimonas sp.]MDZ4112839.1 hypothetical protein [Brevundimonas sp.]